DPGGGRTAEERAVAVEHHDYRAAELRIQFAAGGDQDRLANIIARQPKSRRRRLDRGDAWDDVVVKVEVTADDVEDPKSAVVQRRVTPRQKRADLAGCQLIGDCLRPELCASGVPVGHRCPVVWSAGTGR